MYASYNDSFFNVLAAGLTINTVFEQLRNTDFWEQYMVNAFQFSAAKSAAEMKYLQSLVYDDKKQKRSYADFRKMAEPYQTKFDHWFRVEYDMASHGSIMADKWQRIWRDRDINPYAIYRCQEGACEICSPLDGVEFEIGGAIADKLYTPNHWNCVCTWDTTDKGTPKPDDELQEYLDNVPEDFRYNVGMDGIMPSKNHSYFDVVQSANDFSYNNFSSKIINFEQLNTNYYSEHQCKLAANTWHKEKATTDHKDILFRNHEWKLNVKMTHESLNKISKKAKGFENIKKTIENPSELWGKWVDPVKQKDVIMTYILFDKSKNAYFVETQNGIVKDAYYRSHEDSKNNRRLGVKFIK
jgi:hypothetical protein